MTVQGADAQWLAGLEAAARQVLPPAVHRYFAQGAGPSLSAGEAHRAWEAVRFAPQVLRDVTDIDLRTTLLGHELRLPFGIAPTTLQRAAHPDGELAMARAAGRAGALMVVSSNAGTHFDELRDTGVHWWLQSYLPARRSLARPMLDRAVAAGARAIVLTLDTPVVGTKWEAGESVWDAVDPAWVRVNFDPGHDTVEGARKAMDLGAPDIAWLHDVTGLPVVVKGVLRADAARACVEAGAAAVWVSNHGGRQLDRAIPTAAALAAVVAAVSDDVEVYVDGGLTNGSDLLAAFALGADAAFLGRLPLWALAFGVDSVDRMHRELARQVTECLRLGGVRHPHEAPGILDGG